MRQFYAGQVKYGKTEFAGKSDADDARMFFRPIN